MSLEPAIANAYDEIPFPSKPLSQTQPGRLAAAAILFGMHPQASDRCRVLELGCATGANLIPLADRHPGSTFVGIDFSQRQIAAASEFASALGLKNIEFKHQSITDIDDSLGRFDYIICHGVFSWVSPSIQEQILAICKSHLNLQGVAYVSYNIYPGWPLLGIIRELVCDYTPSTEPQASRVARGRQLLRFFSMALAEDSTPYCRMLKAEIDEALKQHDGYLLHEYFEEENNPLYFHEFVARATGYGLQYLGDAQLATMFVSNFGTVVEQNLSRLASDFVSTEQHLDLLRNRAFRQTLLCHQEVPLVRHFTAANLSRLYFVGAIRPESEFPEIKSPVLVKFVTQRGAMFWSPSPVVKAVFCHLGEQWPRAVSFDELIAAAAMRLGSEGRAAPISAQDREFVCRDLAQCMVQGLLEIRGDADGYVATAGRLPAASRMARHQARAASEVTNRRHEPVALDEVARDILQLLDGQHDRAALLRVFIEAVDRGKLPILVGGLPAARGEAVVGILKGSLEQCLSQLACNALLVQ